MGEEKMKLKILHLLAIVMIAIGGTQLQPAKAQSPAAVQLPPPNVLLIYDKTTVAVINTSSARISLTGFSFMRGGGVYKFNATSIISALDPGHCFQVWTSDVRQIIGKPDECTARDRWRTLSRNQGYFWVGDYDREPFRPQLNGSALTICTAATSQVERCAFHIPQGEDAQKSWAVLDPATGLPMPEGLQVAYDADQIWIGNLMPDTVLPTRTLRLLYTVNGQGIVWTPDQSNWDIGKWDGRGLQGGQCIVLYHNASKVTPLLPCTPIAKAIVAEQPWRIKFDVMGPREERRAACGSDTPQAGPVLCLLAG
jgi:hypothetical protein